MTLIEIMIVMAILGGLMAFLGKTVFSQFGKAQIKQTRIQLSEIGKAFELFGVDCGSLPSTEQGIEALLSDTGSCPNWGPDPYLKKSPKDAWNNEIFYENNGNGGYLLISYGADGREGGEAKNKDITSDD